MERAEGNLMTRKAKRKPPVWNKTSVEIPGTECLWTPEEVAKYYAVKPITVYFWAGKGQLPCIRIGRIVRFKESVVLNGPAKPTPDSPSYGRKPKRKEERGI
jgi:excisionase family DNA binding protein